ncbi:Mo25-like protein [Xylona heveae TC161]|uniref:Mo25-like protein n=1 Tax=Xylona heveae (strain CBS 132557 / TC161) TaxID=1328760 RepID=A0A165IQH1_XYLHT|nr:Mo25-like protein [Xylona heveae TC161]KZF25235.1 Mo25-like protein [Xylona heveae TC161]
MAFLFGRARQKTSPDLAKVARDAISRLDGPLGQKAEEDLAKTLLQMKLVLGGTHDTDSNPEQAYHLVNSIIQEDLIPILARTIPRLPFESRKDCQVVFSYVFRFVPPNGSVTEPPALQYTLHSRTDTVIELCKGYEHRESYMTCGTILRELLKHETVAAIILYDEPRAPGHPIRLNDIDLSKPQSGNGVFWKFFSWINESSFEVSTDAFTTFRELLTKHKQLVSRYLCVNFERFFPHYNNVLVQSDSYVTKRQSIKLLGEILLDRANYQVMTAYVDRGEHLKLCMNLLRDERKMVQYEAFHVFKVFVANPDKSVAVQRILLNNRDRLLRFLPKFLEDRTEDDQFKDEKSYLIRQIETMPPVPIEPARRGGATGGGSAVTASVG